MAEKTLAELTREFDQLIAETPKRAYQYPNRKRLSGTGEKRATLPRWPFWSENLGAEPAQQDELRANLEAVGVKNVEFNEHGAIKIESHDMRNKIMEQGGYFDKDAGYRDRPKGGF